MDPTIIVTNGSVTDWTDVDVSSVVGVGTVNIVLRIVEKSGILGTQVWVRRKGSTAEVPAYRLIDNGSISAETSVDSNYKFQYKTDGIVDIYVVGYLTSEIVPTDVSGLTGETFPVSVSEIVQLLNGTGPDGNSQYTIFGERIYGTMIDRAISISNNYIYMLLGADTTVWAEAGRQTVIKGAIRDFAILRVLATACGVSIPTHYNYTAGGLNIQKPVVSQLRQMLDMYIYSCKRWQRLLLTTHGVSAQTDLVLVPINEQNPPSSTPTQVTYDSQSI